MLDLPLDLNVHIFRFLPLRDIFRMLSLCRKSQEQESRVVYSLYQASKLNIKTYYAVLETAIRFIEDEEDMRIRLPLWRNKRHFRSADTPILMF